jgi:hypothetical protein
LQITISMVHTRSDVRAVIDAIPLLVGRIRGLDVDDCGVVNPATGARLGGLVVTSGMHNVAGARYRLVTEHTAAAPASTEQPPDDAEAVASTQVRRVVRDIELIESDRRSLRLATRPEGAPKHDWLMTMLDPLGFGTIEVSSDRFVQGSFPMRGKLAIHGTADLAQLRAASDPLPCAAIRFQHRWVKGDATFAATRADGSSVRIVIESSVRGRGILRPVIAAGCALFANRVRRSVAKAVDEMMVEWREERAVGGEFSSATIADTLLGEALAVVVPEPQPQVARDPRR